MTAGRWLGGAALAAVAGLALTGCVRLDVDTRLGSDDTLSTHAIIAYDPAIAGDIEDATGMDPAGIIDAVLTSEELAALDAAYPGAVTIEGYEEEDLTGVEVEVDDLPLAALEGATGEGMGVARDGDEFVVALPLGALVAAAGLDGADALGPMTGGGPGLLPGGGGLDLIAGAVDVEIAVTFPGLVTYASAGEVSGKTVTLSLADLIAGEDIELRGGADFAVDWDPVLRWGGIALAVVVIVGGAAILLVRDHRSRQRTALPAPVDNDSTMGLVEAYPESPDQRQGEKRQGQAQQDDER